MVKKRKRKCVLRILYTIDMSVRRESRQEGWKKRQKKKRKEKGNVARHSRECQLTLDQHSVIILMFLSRHRSAISSFIINQSYTIYDSRFTFKKRIHLSNLVSTSSHISLQQQQRRRRRRAISRVHSIIARPGTR